ncbi:uncharacterized protein N7484_008162 [Penicillium longicatenatum]|uniref:uncharacterized protein n=1 Tax=Penicillium longicatenatum TaxID=1561947 RepID=UPI002549675A|nr:uncharacterized protein N7484_008162 [Penicillium longicatenatum]KAJ5640300.1 hypothetical protein N7484_008162 [Penicillium longicatenatum]
MHVVSILCTEFPKQKPLIKQQRKMMHIQMLIERTMLALHIDTDEGLAKASGTNDSFSEMDAIDMLDIYLRPPTRWDPPGHRVKRSDSQYDLRIRPWLGI